MDVTDGSSVLVYADPGTTISATSTAVLHDNRLYLGQVFNDGIVSCRLP